MGFIYMFTSPSNKRYIGQTTRTIEERFNEHQTKCDCVAIYNAIQKYGWENVKKEWFEVPDDELNFYEEMLVELYETLAPSGYNLKEGGGNGGRMCEEVKKKMSESRKGDKNHLFGKTGENHPTFGRTGDKHPMYVKTHTK
jgi:group I intron endonuclease